jgi:hypothetical protein
MRILRMVVTIVLGLAAGFVLCVGLHILGLFARLDEGKYTTFYVMTITAIFGGLGMARSRGRARPVRWKLVTVTCACVCALFTGFLTLARASATFEILDSGYSKCGIAPKDIIITVALILGEQSGDEIKLHGAIAETRFLCESLLGLCAYIMAWCFGIACGPGTRAHRHVPPSSPDYRRMAPG